MSRIVSFLEDRRAVTLAVSVMVGAWTVLALAVIPSNGHFLFDEAVFYDQAWKTGKFERFPVLGPMVSYTNPTAHTPGGGLFLVMGVPFVFFSDPRAGSCWLILLSAIAILVLDRALRVVGASGSLRFFSALFLTWSLWHGLYSDRIWNVHLYWSVSPLMLATTLTAMKRGFNAWLGAAFGLLAALAAQVHLGGLLAVAFCAAIFLRFDWKSLRASGVVAMALAFIAMYVPYVVSELRNGFEFTSRLASGRPPTEFEIRTIFECLVAPFRFLSHYAYSGHGRNTGFQPGGTQLLAWNPAAVLQLLCYAGATILAIAGLWRERSWRWIFLGITLLTAIYFVVGNRHYEDHYVSALMPFAVMLPAAGAAWLVESDRWRPAVIGFAALFVATGIYLMIEFYHSGDGRTAVPARLERIREIMGEREMVEVRVPSQNVLSVSDELYTLHILAHHCLGRQLTVTAQE